MKNLILSALAVAMLFGCRKEVKELAPETATGAGTFGANVNGTLWAPLGFGIVPTAPLIEASFGGGDDYFINARNFSCSPNESEFEFFLKDVKGPGTYLLNQNTQIRPSHRASYAYYVERRGRPLREWITSQQTPGTVVITRVDKSNRILAGTFRLRMKPLSGDGGIIEVTDGRFDVRIQ